MLNQKIESERHGGEGCSVAASQFRGPQFGPKLGLLSIHEVLHVLFVVSSGFCGFLLKTC